MRHRPDLDGIRAFAVLAVIFSHTGIAAANSGWMGVDAFFVLSGFLITTLLLAERDRTGAISLPRFYLRRALRLYPALIAVLVAGVVAYRWLGDGGTLSGYGLTALISGGYVEDFVYGFTGNGHGGFGHTWSLAVEEQFYLLWPCLLVVLLRSGRRPLGWALSWAAVLAVGSWVVMDLSLHPSRDGVPLHAYYLPWSAFWLLMLGCVVALLVAQQPAWLGRSQAAMLGRTWFGLATVAVLVVALAAADRFSRSPGLWWESSLCALGVAALLTHLMSPGAQSRLVARVLAWSPFAWMGRRSYAMYLWHVPIVGVLGHVLHERRMVEVAVLLVCTLIAAELSYRLVERPFLRLKSRFEGGRPVPVAVPPQVVEGVA